MARPKADTLLRFAEPEVVLGQASLFYCKSEFEKYKHIYFLILGVGDIRGEI